METPFPLGTVVAGRFRLDAFVAEGGMGVVYRAMELRQREGQARDVRPVAIKLISPRRAADEAYLTRFERETDTVVRLQHPNIVPVIDFGEWEGRPYIAFAWIAGEDLGERISRAGRLTLDETIRILGPVADALDAAHHTGLVHRDVKPGNILLGGRDEVYLTDFGLARPSDALAAPTLPGSRLMGTAPFIAPEQLRPRTIRPELASRIDIYALACVAFACLTGDGPFRRDSDEAVIFAHVDEAPPRISEVRPDLPAPIDPVLERALAKDPAARFATAREFVSALRTAATAVVPPVIVEPPPQRPDNTRPLPQPDDPVEPPPRRPSRAPLLAAAGGAGLIALAVLVASAGGGPGATRTPGPTLVAGATSTPRVTATPETTPDSTPIDAPTPTPVEATPVDPTPVEPTPDGATPAPTGNPENQARLLATVSPVGSFCALRSLLGREIAAVSCETPGSDYSDYGLYETWDDISVDWTGYIEDAGVEPDSGSTCEQGTPSESWWYYEDPEVQLGRLVCYTSETWGWVLTWTDNRNLTWGFVSREDGDVAAGWEAWKAAIIPPQ